MSEPDESHLIAARVSEAATLGREIAGEIATQVRGAVGYLWRIRADVALSLAVGVAMSAYALFHWFQFNPARLLGIFDVWFESDMPRIATTLTDRISCMHYRTSVHPLASLLLATPSIVAKAAGVKANGVFAGYIGAGAFLFGALLYATLRTMNLYRLDAVIVSALVATSAACTYWLSVPENYAWGASTILVPILWLASPRGAHDRWTGPVQSAISFSITITNWMAGIIAAVIALGVRRAILVSVAGLMIVSTLVVAQYELYPRAGAFLNIQEEKLYSVLTPSKTSFSPVTRVVAMADHVFVAPKYQIIKQDERLAPYKLSYQNLEIANDPAGAIALVGWLSLLGLGFWAAVSGRVSKSIAVGVGLILLANVLLHMVYGEELFLYSMHFITIYAVIIGWACLRWRWIALPLMVITAVASQIHNEPQFRGTVDVVNSGKLWPNISGPLIPPCPPSFL